MVDDEAKTTPVMIHTGIGHILALIAASGGSFSNLEPAAQAIVQAAAKVIVHSSYATTDLPAILALIKAVPLMHNADYNALFKRPYAGASKQHWQEGCLVMHCAPCTIRLIVSFCPAHKTQSQWA
jgi:hypothetical protein